MSVIPIIPRRKSKRYCIAAIVAALESHYNKFLHESMLDELGVRRIEFQPMPTLVSDYEHREIAKKVLDMKCPGALGSACKECLYYQRVVLIQGGRNG